MKKMLLVAATLVAAIFACTRLSQTPAPATDPPIPNCFCADTTRCNTLCSQLPIDVNEKFFPGYSGNLTPTFQPPFDIFSWQTFIALNWPADAKGNPLDCPLGDKPGAPRVWEGYTDPAQIFGTGDATLLLAVNNAANAGQKFFYRFSKSPHTRLSSGMGDPDDFDDREADGHALIDRNLNFALFEIRVNPDETKFIRDSGLTTLAGIDAYWKRNGHKFELPSSNLPSTVGAMEIKASWRILDPALGDDTTRYYTRNAIIQVSAKNSSTGQAFTVQAKVGLVGMHIIRKTKSFPFLIWSTFEHMDNTPDDVQGAQTAHDTARHWSFYNVECLTCPVNIGPEPAPADSGHYKWNPKPPYAARYAQSVPGEDGSYGSQVTRTYPIYYRTQQVNALWQAKLKGTVWANYRLVGSQWTVANDGGTSNTNNVPFLLGNTTLESFIQVDASCIACHTRYAYVKYDTDSIPTDMSFIFGDAQ